MAAPENYPVEWEADVVLADGGTARLRPIRPDDADLLVDFYARVSDESKYLRFFAPYPVLSDADIEKFTVVDYHDRVALILVERDRMIAVGRYDRTTPTDAEVAFLVEDGHQGRGVGQLLLEHLAEAAREREVARFTAEVLPQNRRMVKVFADAGYTVKRAFDDGVIVVEFPIEPTDTSMAVMERREHRAEAASIRRLLQPERVVLVGAAGRLRRLVHTVQSAGFRGALEVVVTDGEEVSGVPNTASLAEVEGDIDLVCAAVGAAEVADIVLRASDRHASGVVILASTSEQHDSLDPATLVGLARSHGLRAVGPQALGLINTDHLVQLNVSPAPMPRSGVVGIYSQSAAVGVILLSRALTTNVGVSNFITSGSFADVTGNDVMQFWEDDPATQVCVLSLDALGNPRKFTRIARRLASRKPVVVFAPSHAERAHHAGVRHDLPEAPAVAVDSLFRQSGVIVVDRRDHMYDIAQILARQPLPKGRRVRVVTTSFALSHHVVSHCTRNRLHPDPAVVTATGDWQAAVSAAEQALADDTVDAVVCTIALLEDDSPLRAHEALSVLAATSSKPLIGVFIDFTAVEAEETGPDGPGHLPTFSNYGEAVQALGEITDYALWREEQENARVIEPDTDLEAAEALVERVLTESPLGRRLDDGETEELLAAFGIPCVSHRHVDTTADAVAVAEEFGWSVVLKATRPGVRGRPDLASVFRNLDSAEEMAEAWEDLGRLVAALGVGGPDDQKLAHPVVQPQAPPGVALRLRAIEDPAFGPMVSIGVDGLPAELLGDVSWAVPPLTRGDAVQMVAQLKAAPLLMGRDGAAPVDLERVYDLLHRLVALKDALPQVSEVVLTPVQAAAGDLWVLGARAHLVPAGQRDAQARTLG
ncbi:MAG: GNAT family N-acetyltransferase [Propionibacterium sp.]|nr:GNAT family N-acetyltransferase [Propionibacterium sp.]